MQKSKLNNQKFLYTLNIPTSIYWSSLINVNINNPDSKIVYSLKVDTI